MANEQLQGNAASPKKRSKLLLISIIAIVLLAGSGGAAYFFLFMPEEVIAVELEENLDDVQAARSDTSAEVLAIYVSMPRPFQFNAPGISRERLVQIEVQLMVRGQNNEELARRHIPMIEGKLLQVFSASNADDLVTDVGKTELRNKATAQVKQVMKNLEKNTVVEEVLFTGFVIQ
jgi:flagellar FliL protein